MRLRLNPPFLPTLVFGPLLACAASAQQPVQNPSGHDSDATATTTTDANSPAPPLTPEQIALLDRYLTNVRVQPIGKIETRNAAAGQTITLQITRTATLANGTELPAGTRLTGHILRAQPYAESSAAVLSFAIDRALLKDGRSIPVRCVIRGATVTEVASTGLPDASQPGSRRRNNNSSSLGGPTSGTVPLGNPIPMGGPISGDSSAGNIGNSPAGNGADYPGAPGNPNSNGIPGTASGGNIPIGDPGIGGGTRPPLPNTTAVAATAPAERPVVSAGDSIRDTPHPSGLPGVMLSGASLTGVSGTLTAYERNFTLDSGTQLMLGVISR